MYRLYLNDNGWEELDRKPTEGDIVYSLQYYYKKYKGGYFGIVRDIGNGDEAYKFIRNEQDYNDYIQFYKNKMLQELSVIELKEQILDIKEGKKKI